jgi:II/X family phage/plasmid replication protein
VIDWTSCVLPLHHASPIHGGSVISADADGVIEYHIAKRRSVMGSAESAVTIRTHRGDLSQVEVSGNLVKFFQGHNLWGTNDLVPLVAEFAETLVATHGEQLQLDPTEADRAAWWAGEFDVTRVDVTDSFRLRTLADVLSWLRAAEQTAHLAHRGRGQLTKGSTLVFGKQSRRESLKLYAKGQEVVANIKHQPALQQLPHVVEWAQGILRTELVLRAMQLTRLGLRRASAWCSTDEVHFNPLDLLRERLGNMTMTTVSKVSAELLASLRPSERTAVVAWEAGADLRAFLTRATFYRMRAKLLPHGIDLATVLPKENANVVPLVRFLEAVPASIPEWAHGTPLLFEPRRRRAA